jgi:type IV fimbrial biogenesis protein FimT
MKKEHGFTLLEIIVTLAIIALVMAFAIPGMGTFIKNERLTTQINALVGHLAYARSEAVLRTQQVAVCVSNDTTSCTGGNSWEDGWIVYVDVDGNGSFSGGEIILRAQPTLEGNNTLTPAIIGTQVIYDYRGYLGSPVGSLLLCDDRSGPYGKTLSISTTGRVRASRGATC